MRFILVSLTFLSVFATLAGFLGALHPALDTLSLGRPGFSVLIVLGAFAFRRRIIRWATLGVGVIGMASVLAQLLPGPAEGDFRVYSKNMRHSHIDARALVDDILAQSVDAVLLQEVPAQDAAVQDLLREEFPHQHLCRYDGAKGIAVLSRVAFTQRPRCTGRRALAAAQIEWQGQPLWLVSKHIPWPWPHDARVAERQAHDVLGELDAPVVMAGDFNMVPWSARVQGYARATGTRLAGPMQITFERLPVPLSIDHVLAPGGGHITRRPMFGSDHAGLVAEVGL